ERAVDVDRALARLAEEVLGPRPEAAVVAVGGYGRGELAPHSDIDLLLLLAPRAKVSTATLRGFLYPLWDAGWQVGHAVRGPKEAVELSSEDLDAATALLSARLVAGDEELFAELAERRARWLKRNSKILVRRIVETTRERHARMDRAGWALAPELKEDRGGLRDVHACEWVLAIAGEGELPKELVAAAGVLTAAREALHAETKRKRDRLSIHLQPAVARRLSLASDESIEELSSDSGADKLIGDSGADKLMAEVHTSARTIEHVAAATLAAWTERLTAGPRRSGTRSLVGPGVWLEDGRLSHDRAAAPSASAGMALIAAVSLTGRELDAGSMDWVRACFSGPPPDHWEGDLRAAFRSLLAGPHSASGLELLDHVGGFQHLLPEWARIRGRAQHDPYHRFTVDGHSFIAVENVTRCCTDTPEAADAAALSGDTGNLYLATLFHDVGKGSGEDHSVAGERIARTLCVRMGLSDGDTDEVTHLVRHHLLLVDTATRRDLSDGAIIARVTETVGTPRALRHFFVLSIADGRATGPEGWTSWKAALVLELYRKVLVALETGEIPARSDVSARARELEAYEPLLSGRAEEVLATLPHSYMASTTVSDMADDVRMLLHPPSAGEIRCRIERSTEPGLSVLTVCLPDRPGTLARTAGVLALNRVSVMSAQAYSTSTGVALERFIVSIPEGSDHARLETDLEAAYSGRLALEARLERKVREYGAPKDMTPEVRVVASASEHSTVIEVRAPDAIGLLYALTAALSELDLDIHIAKIDTLGHRVVDVFYVRTRWGDKLDDAQTAEVARSIEHRIARLFGRDA
ncbi:MAG TPA: [protein-PII] uridylyltransferase, partial [Actinomycetota bacterium]|nr:[protein-PII] uridylyltransferase [Actinomycetota bacterium]